MRHQRIPTSVWSVLCLGCLAASGCLSITPRVPAGPTIGRTLGTPGGDGYGPGRPSTNRDTGTVFRPRDRAVRGAAIRGDLATRRQCRAAGIPSGWITVAYEAASTDCPGLAAAARDSSATVSVIVRYATAPVGTVLDVCADQRVPSGWTRRPDEAPDDAGACPGAARRGDATVVRIRRDF